MLASPRCRPVSCFSVSRQTVERAAVMERGMVAALGAWITERKGGIIRCLFLLFVSGSAVSRNRHETSRTQILAGDGVSACGT